MSAVKKHLVGHGDGDIYTEVHIWLSYFGANNTNPKISAMTGNGPVSKGPTLSPGKIREFRPHVFHDEIIDGQSKTTKIEQEPLGWFTRKCEEAGCAWFLPYVDRMAAGEDVPLEEIQFSYREHNEGREMPQGEWRGYEI